MTDGRRILPVENLIFLERLGGFAQSLSFRRGRATDTAPSELISNVLLATLGQTHAVNSLVSVRLLWLSLLPTSAITCRVRLAPSV